MQAKNFKKTWHAQFSYMHRDWTRRFGIEQQHDFFSIIVQWDEIGAAHGDNKEVWTTKWANAPKCGRVIGKKIRGRGLSRITFMVGEWDQIWPGYGDNKEVWTKWSKKIWGWGLIYNHNHVSSQLQVSMHCSPLILGSHRDKIERLT